MNAVTDVVTPALQGQKWRAALDRASAGIAPAWPLDELIAVNPFWEYRHHPVTDVSAHMAVLAGVTMLAPSALADSAQALPPSNDDLQHSGNAARNGGVSLASAANRMEDSRGLRWRNISSLLDEQRDDQHSLQWDDVLCDHISRFCADHSAADAPVDGSLYEAWISYLITDKSLGILMEAPGLLEIQRGLPDDRELLFEAVAYELEITASHAEQYATALLWSINGWAARYAWERWQANLHNTGAPDRVTDLLAIRMGWELLLWRYSRKHQTDVHAILTQQWQHQQLTLGRAVEEARRLQTPAWCWQRAAEHRWQQHLENLLLQPPASPIVDAELQAVFCIDVRSEVIRRHLEHQSQHVQTLGFAGFFGLPLALERGGQQLPQLPGLLAPSLTAKVVAQPKLMRNAGERVLKQAGQRSPSVFALVEALGLGYALKLLTDTLAPKSPNAQQFLSNHDLHLERDGHALGVSDAADLLQGILGAMGLTKDFAPHVLLVGHTSQSRNNPHAGSLDCGACGGHSGEPNVRLLAELLNNVAIRKALWQRGIKIPDRTTFFPALHNTTTDAVDILSGQLPDRIEDWLHQASAATRRERAAALGLDPEDPKLRKKLTRRAHDWSQVRPEWGLAGNAAFIAAPRQLTRGKHLGGRVFLHDYDSAKDPSSAVLELIMTAPVVVAHWINSQYNASVAEPEKLGAGNKVLHNIVGGNVGVLEGGAGDLRVGLPLQSVHDGKRWMHTPLRLSVYLQAPKEKIFAIYERHSDVRSLIDNEWLYLFALDDGGVHRLLRGSWQG